MKTAASRHYVRHPKKPEWGVGEVISQNGDNVRVAFALGGMRTLNTQYVELSEATPDPVCGNSPGSRPVDIERIRELCHRFIREMKDNRRHYNDAGVAENILDEIERRGSLTVTTAKRLAAWCNTDGSVFQAGVGLAQDISVAICGRILREDEF